MENNGTDEEVKKGLGKWVERLGGVINRAVPSWPQVQLSLMRTGWVQRGKLASSLKGWMEEADFLPKAGSAHSLYCSGVQYGASPKDRETETISEENSETATVKYV